MMKNIEKYKDLLWFKVFISYEPINEAKIASPIKEGARFYIWREKLDASTAELNEFIEETPKALFPRDNKEAYIVMIPSDLSNSFKVNEELVWGIPQKRMGNIIIIEIIDVNTLLLEDYITLYRPVNQKELDLIEKLNFRGFPPRLKEQPFFYPVLNEEYASRIAKEWNVPAYGIGYVEVVHFRFTQLTCN
jgi:hypothetical protein